MSEEWDEVVHEVQLMVGQLCNFCNDLLAAENSGALTGLQITFVKMVRAWAVEAVIRIDNFTMPDATKDETAEEGEAG